MKRRFLYKIRNIKDGKFSNGSMFPRFTKVGKEFKDTNGLRNHLNQINRNTIILYKECCELCKYEVVDKGVDKELFEVVIGEREKFYKKCGW